MGCRCCRMIKSYIYDPSVPVDVHGRKRDAGTDSLYQHKVSDLGQERKLQGFHNFGYSGKTSDGPKPPVGSLENGNNRINRLHCVPPRQDGTRYILEPEAAESPKTAVLSQNGPRDEAPLERVIPQTSSHNVTPSVAPNGTDKDLDQKPVDTIIPLEVGGVIAPVTLNHCDSKGEEPEVFDSISITDSDVAEALAALDAATAGEQGD